MSSERVVTAFSLTMVAMVAAFLAACAMEVDADEEVWKEQSEVSAVELMPEKSMETEESFVSDAELVAGAMDSEKGSADKGVITPNVTCRRVVDASVPAFPSTGSRIPLCHFFSW